jgi:isopropylmalate/homocitrate/citramalate synthase
MTQIPAAVAIREVGPRDGLQLEQPLASGQKLQLIEALAGTGVGRIEATAFVSLAESGIQTGIDLDRCLDAARLAQELVGHPLDSNLVRAGGRSQPAARAS